MTVRAKTTAASNGGSFAPEHRGEVDVDLEAELDAAWDAKTEEWLAERAAEDEATDYLRSVLNPGKDKVAPRDAPRHPVNECTGADLPRVAYLGKQAYDESLVQPIKNIVGFSKPEGGTWLSPLHDDGSTVWTKHCKVIQYESATKDRTVHPVGLHPEARVLKIDTVEDLRGAIDTYGGIQREDDDQLRPDFEELAKHYDALWLTRRGMNATYVPVGGRHVAENLNAWEIESVLVLRPDAVDST